ncbi:hypothetical protein [Actinomadura montaniterrae]|uniref:DUF3995 domain-containing protein n=1 Tax=Actinomadura montaniterrae TaxID=1803903 RepID=A0A6L3W098_9ACTN|nr:hypothetical protein [Actinomadura montaniterrae]KAB2382730.1 hypothetical protein F9B16_14130 [Actinomadura montaniterrae]
MTDSAVAAARPRRLQAMWSSAHAPAAGTPRWARTAALAVPFVVLPSSLWRIAAVALHVPIVRDTGGDESGNLPSWLPIELYVVLLSVLSELLAFTAVGLVSTWGEVFPRWVPFLRGRRVPTLAAVVPGAIGATILTCLWTWVFAMLAFGRNLAGERLAADSPLNVHTWQGALVFVAYVPLVAWGPLLAAVTFAYYRRRAQGA